MHGEIAGRHVQQDVIVIRAQERRDGDDAVAAGTVLDHHRLAPALRQLVGEQTGADVDGSARSERHDEPDRPRRPSRRLRVANSQPMRQEPQARRPRRPISEVASPSPHVRLARPVTGNSDAIRRLCHPSSKGTPALLRRPRSTASGLSGNSISRTPTASSMAFATAGDTHIVAEFAGALGAERPLC